MVVVARMTVGKPGFRLSRGNERTDGSRADVIDPRERGPITLRMYYPPIWRVAPERGLPAVNHKLVQQLLLLVSIKI